LVEPFIPTLQLPVQQDQLFVPINVLVANVMDRIQTANQLPRAINGERSLANVIDDAQGKMRARYFQELRRMRAR
jgi:hypothetical protein